MGFAATALTGTAGPAKTGYRIKRVRREPDMIAAMLSGTASGGGHA
jgi:hypothetical protein